MSDSLEVRLDTIAIESDIYGSLFRSLWCMATDMAGNHRPGSLSERLGHYHK